MRAASILLVATAVLQPAASNRVFNGDARQGTAGWKVVGLATTEVLGGVPCFTVRSPARFTQEITLAPSDAGSYAAIVGRGHSERVNANGSITGLPYLYGMVLNADHTRFLAYWQGQQMRARPEQPGQWVTMSGVFRVPEGAAAISLQLQQAERKDDPQDGSAARITDVRMVLFPTEDAARTYVSAYR